MALEEGSTVLVKVPVTEVGRGLCSPGVTHKPSTAGWVEGSAWPGTCPSSGAEKAPEKPLLLVDGKTEIPLERAGLKSPFLPTPYTNQQIAPKLGEEKQLKTTHKYKPASSEGPASC